MQTMNVNFRYFHALMFIHNLQLYVQCRRLIFRSNSLFDTSIYCSLNVYCMCSYITIISSACLNIFVSNTKRHEYDVNGQLNYPMI